MEKINLISPELEEKFLEHSANLSVLLHTFKLFRYSIENEVDMSGGIEICSFGAVLEKYIEQTKNDFQSLKEILGIL